MRADEDVQHVKWHDQHIATLIRSGFAPRETTFVTPDSYYQQAGFVVYPGGGAVRRHVHLPVQRYLVGTPETLIVVRGRLEIDLYGLDKSSLGTWELRCHDIMLLVAGGHGLRFLEDTTLLEIKQGPYTGLAEKEMF